MTDEQEPQLATIPQPEEEPLVYGSDDTALVRIYNAELDAYGESPRAGVKYLPGWEIVDPTPEEAARATDYDPSAHSASEVVAHLEEVPQSEREAIIALEKDGKNRSTIVKS